MNQTQFLRYVLLNVAFGTVSGERLNYSLFFNFFIKSNRVHYFNYLMQAKIGLFEVIKVENTT